MQIGMIGLGRMGANMTRRLLAAEHECVVYARSMEAVRELSGLGAVGAGSPREMVGALNAPRAVWLMIPAAAVDEVVAELSELLEPGDIVIDGGNSHYAHDRRRSSELGARGIHYLDVGVSGGVWGLEAGYCQMIGGELQTAVRLLPVFAALAPGSSRAEPSAEDLELGRTAPDGYLYCGASGAGHFVKMIHNGIEYGLMAAYAEGFNLLKAEHFRFDLDLAAIAEVWRHGSVIRSWLLDLTGNALRRDADLGGFAGEVGDSGEGRWTIDAAVEAGVPAPVLATALFARFSSRSAATFANRVLSAMRFEFGGHAEHTPKAASGEG